MRPRGAEHIMSGREEFDWERMRQEEDAYFTARQSESKTIRTTLANVMREARKIEHCSEVEADELARLERLPYREYLKTDYWQSKRQTILERDEFQCRDCGCPDRLNVHHKNYLAPRGQERDTDLLTLCRWCHIARHRESIPGAKRHRPRSIGS